MLCCAHVSRLQRRGGNLQALSGLSKSCPAVGGEAAGEDSEDTSGSESWGSATPLSDPFAESGEEAAAPVSRAEKLLARQSLRHAKKREVQQKRNMEQNKISMDDYLGQQAHFRMWLQEEQKKQAKDLTSPKRKTYFKMFVRLWNKRHLPPKYYESRLSWHTQEEEEEGAGLPSEKGSPLTREGARFSLLQLSPALDPSLFPHTINLSSDSLTLPAPSPFAFSTFGKSSTPLSSGTPFKFAGSDGKKALSEHMVTPRHAGAGKAVFRFGENKENRAHHSLPIAVANAEHLRTATISPRKKMMSTCQGRSMDRVLVNWSPRGQHKLNPVDSPRCPSPLFTALSPSAPTTTTTSKEEEDNSRSDVYDQVKDVLSSGSPVYAEIPAGGSVDDGEQIPSVPCVVRTTQGQGPRRRSRSVDGAPLYAVPNKLVRDRAWAQQRPVCDEAHSVSPPPIPPKCFDPHVEGLGIPFSPPVLAQNVNAQSWDTEKGGGERGVSGKENAKKSSKMFKFSWFGKKLSSRRRSRSCEALSPCVQRAGEMSQQTPACQPGDNLFPLISLDSSPTLSRRVLTRPHRPPGKQPDSSQEKQSGNSATLSRVMEKNRAASHTKQSAVTQQAPSLAGQGDEGANSKPAHKLKFELTEYSSSPLRVGGGDRLVPFSGTEEGHKRAVPPRRRSRSMEHIPSGGQDRLLMSAGASKDPATCCLYDEVKLEVYSGLSSLVNKLQQTSGAHITQTPYQHCTTSVTELQRSPKRLGRREKAEETPLPERMDLQEPYPEVTKEEERHHRPLPVSQGTTSQGSASPSGPHGISAQHYQGAQQTVYDNRVSDNDVVTKDEREEELPGMAELQLTHSPEGESEQKSSVVIVEMHDSHGIEEITQHGNSEAMTDDVQCTGNSEAMPDVQCTGNSEAMPDVQCTGNSEAMPDVQYTGNIKQPPHQKSSEEMNAVKSAHTDDTAAPLMTPQVPVPDSLMEVTSEPFMELTNEPLMELTRTIDNILQTAMLTTHTELGAGESLAASSTPDTVMADEKDVPPSMSLCQTASEEPAISSGVVVRATASHQEIVRPPLHREDVAFSLPLPTAQLTCQVSMPLPPHTTRRSHRRRSRSVDMTLSGLGSLHAANSHTPASGFGSVLHMATIQAKKSDAEEQQRTNETKISDVIDPVVQGCKQPPPPTLSKTHGSLKTPACTDSEARSALAGKDHPPATLPKTQTSLRAEAVTDNQSASQSGTDSQVTAENGAVPAVVPSQHGGLRRPATRSRHRRRSRSVGDTTTLEGKGSGLDSEEGGGFASVRAFWDSMRGRGGEGRGSGVSLQRKPSTMRRLQQQLFGSQQTEGGKDAASPILPPVTPQHPNGAQSSTPPSVHTTVCGAGTKPPPPPPTERSTSTVNEEGQSKTCPREKSVHQVHQPATPLKESKTVNKPVCLPPSEECVSSSLQDAQTQGVKGVGGSSWQEPGAAPNHQQSADSAAQGPAGGREEGAPVHQQSAGSAAQGPAGGREDGAPVHHSPFVTVRRQSSRKRSMLSESGGTPGRGSPQRSWHSPGHQAQGPQHCYTPASGKEGHLTPPGPTQTKSLEGSADSMKTVGVVKATAVCFVNLEPHQGLREPFITQTMCSPGSGKKKPPPPKPLPKPTRLPSLKAANPSLCSRQPGLSLVEPSAVSVKVQVSGGVSIRKLRSQELEQAGDKRRPVGDGAQRQVAKALIHHRNTAVSSQSSPPSHESHSPDTDTGVRRGKRCSGDKHEHDLPPVKRRSGGNGDHVPPAATTGHSLKKTQPAPASVWGESGESLKKEETQSPIGQRPVKRGERQSLAQQNKSKPELASIKRQSSGKGPSSTPATKWSSVRAPSAVSDSSTTGMSTRRESSSRVIVTRRNSGRKSVGIRQTNSPVTVTRRDSGRISVGIRQTNSPVTVTRRDSGRISVGIRQTNSPVTVTRQTNSPVTVTRQANSPVTVTRQTNSPVTVTRQTNSPVTVTRQTNSPVTVTRQANSPVTVTRQTNSPVTVTRQANSPVTVTRQANSPVTVTRQASSRSSSGRRQSRGGNTPARTDSNRRQSGGRQTPLTNEGNKRQSGTRGTPSTRDGNRRQSAGRGTPTGDGNRKQSGGEGMVRRSGSNRAQGAGQNRSQALISTPVRTSSLARRRSGAGGSTAAPKRSSSGKPRRDSGGLRRGDSGRGHRAGDPHGQAPSRSSSSSFKKQGPKTPQSPTFMRITRHLGVCQEQSSNVCKNLFAVDEQQAQQIIAGLHKAQEKACEPGRHDTGVVENQRQEPCMGNDPSEQAGRGEKGPGVVSAGEDEGRRVEPEDMETDIDSWEEDGVSAGAGEGGCSTHLSTLV
ncbi:hypothetical protein ACOMHN_053798 [Nucella lapillus]